jgi:hypothetical protein
MIQLFEFHTVASENKSLSQGDSQIPNQQRAWYEAYLHYFSQLQLEFDRIDINFFPTKKYIIISSKKVMQQKK